MNRESAPSRGRHRAPNRPTAVRRAALATVAMSAPLVPATLIAAPAAHADTDWDALAQCESSGNWAANTGNGFSGGLQFTPSTWKSFGGSGSPQSASRSEQISVAERVKAAQGMKAWPVCSKKTGNTDSSPNSGAVETVSTPTKASSKAAPKATPRRAAPKTAPKKHTRVAAARTEAPAGGSYTVRQGDTLGGIAASHGMSWRAMQASNPVITDPNMIFPGQTLTMS